jgi:alpha,alpha-trehalase
MPRVTLHDHEVAAAIFDTDGVITDTASVHEEAWKDVFDEYLRERARREGRDFTEFTSHDYLTHVDGVSRNDGVRRFLASRDIELEEGEPGDPGDRESVHGLGNGKNARFLERLRREGAPAYPGTVAFLRWLRDQGVPTAVISASRNAAEVLTSAGAAELFDTRVDGVTSAELALPGKPDPAVFLEAARRLGVAPADTMVVEDALSGVRAGRRGGFGLVVGVDRAGHREELLSQGADVVVDDLAELLPPETG